MFEINVRSIPVRIGIAPIRKKTIRRITGTPFLFSSAVFSGSQPCFAAACSPRVTQLKVPFRVVSSANTAPPNTKNRYSQVGKISCATSVRF